MDNDFEEDEEDWMDYIHDRNETMKKVLYGEEESQEGSELPTKVIRIKSDRLSFPKCGAMLSLATRKFWHGRGRPGNPKGKETCDLAASFKIDGKYFCGKHGGSYVLNKLAQEDTQ